MSGMSESTALIVELLAKDIPQNQVCKILQLSASTVSEVATTYAEQIELESLGAKLAQVENDEIMDRIETASLKKLEALVAWESDPAKVLKIFTAMNQATRRSRGEQLHRTNVQVNVVQLQVPAALQQREALRKEIVVNSNSEVVAIGDQTMAPASRQQVEARLQAAQDFRAAQQQVLPQAQAMALAVEDI